MASLRTPSNGPPAPAAAQRIRAFIKSREKILESTLMDIIDHESSISTSRKAIGRLQVAMADGRPALAGHETNLKFLKQLKKAMSSNGLVENRNSLDEADSRALYDEIKAHVTSSLGIISAQITRLEIQKENLSRRLRNMAAELKDWESYHSLRTTALRQVIATKTGLVGSIKSARIALGILWMVPVEIWREIFKMVVQVEFENYLAQDKETPLRATALVLSHVCRFWRETAHNAREIWSIITAHPTQNWPQRKYDLFGACIGRARPPHTILVNLSQKLDWSRDHDYGNKKNKHQGDMPGRLRDGSGNLIQQAQTNWTGMMNSKPYNLRLDMTSDHSDVMLKTTYLPFQNPLGLTLISHSPLQHNLLFSQISHFRGVKSLTVINDKPTSISSARFSTSLPQLEELKLLFKKLPSDFRLSGLLSVTITEFHLRHESPTPLPQLSADTQLPKLRTLGITPQCLAILERVQVPAIETLILYNSTGSSTAGLASSRGADEAYGKITRVEFVDWKEPRRKLDARVGLNAFGELLEMGRSRHPEVEDKKYGDVVAVFGDLAAKAPLLRSVRFEASWVDGEALVTTMDTVWHVKDPEILPNLEEITLSHTTGITRDTCDRLKPMVKKLNIYV